MGTVADNLVMVNAVIAVSARGCTGWKRKGKKSRSFNWCESMVMKQPGARREALHFKDRAIQHELQLAFLKSAFHKTGWHLCVFLWLESVGLSKSRHSWLFVKALVLSFFFYRSTQCLTLRSSFFCFCCMPCTGNTALWRRRTSRVQTVTWLSTSAQEQSATG